MHTSELTPEIRAALSEERPYPAITLVVPTDADFPFSEKNRITLRDLVTEAKRRLADDPDVGREIKLELRDHVLDPAVIEREVDPFHPDDAMVVYLAANEPVQVWQMTSLADVEPRVEFASSFLTRYLVGAEQRSRPFLVLVLDQDMCRLYHGSVRRLVQVEHHGFPCAPEIPSPEDALPGLIPHSAPYEGHEERVQQYLRRVDKRLGDALGEHSGLPLFVIGGDKILSAFKGITTYGNHVAGTLPLTGMDKDRPQDLMRRLEPVLAEFYRRQVAEAVNALNEAHGQGKYAGGPAEVWTAVADKRVQQLIVEEGLVLAGRITGDGRMLELVEMSKPVTLPEPKQDIEPPPRSMGVATDIVEQLVDRAIAADTQVLFVPDGTLVGAGGVAALLRY
ncbi:baeRF3 domain-containing protein [Streptomyces sp. NPDC002520]